MLVPLSKIHEGCDVLLTDLSKNSYFDKSAVRFFIESVNVEANRFQFRYYWPNYSDKQMFPTMTNDNDFSQSVHWGHIDNTNVFEVKARYNQPVNFWREIKIAAIQIIHLIMERMGFNFS